MSEGAAATVSAVAFVRLGMVLAISFLETRRNSAPRAGRCRWVSASGRLVFRALDGVEALLAAVAPAAALAGDAPGSVLGPAAVLAALPAVQVGGVRWALTRRTDRVLAGEELPRSRGHLAHVGCEVAKVALPVALGAASAAA
jgi:hypothetical protein